jgi:hypothetical protein
MKKILIAGGSGLVGSRLTELLIEKGYTVQHLSRSQSKGPVATYQWNVDKLEVDAKAFEGVDVVINLAGSGIADKAWTKARMEDIINSRVNATKTIYNFLTTHTHQVSAYIGASAIGIYGNLEKENLTETDTSNEIDFMVDCCKLWETQHQAIAKSDIRTVIIRIGIVLSPKGGALKEMLKPFDFFTGAYFGDGSMMTSWIHIDDLCNQFIYSIEQKNLHGIYNGVAPLPVSNKNLIRAIAAIMKPLLIMPVPRFMLNLILGKRSVVVFQSLHVSSKKMEQAGFNFMFKDVSSALKDLLKKR